MKGINVYKLLTSDIFCHQLYFDEWPQIHSDNSEVIKPYNESLFRLRNQYYNIFQDFQLDEGDEDNEDEENIYYKIKYTLN